MKWIRRSLLFLALAVLGCAAQTESPQGNHEAIRNRSTNHFLTAVLYKPDSRFETDPAFQLAPLIVQELAGGDGRGGAHARAIAGGEAGEKMQPVVYAHADVVPFRGTNLLRFAYVWVYEPEQAGSVEQIQGVRVTVDTQGRPILWEPLNPGSNTRVLFASAEIEQQAAKEFGAVQKGRRFALERSETEEPDTVLARVLDDGPVAMGPIVYVTAEPSLVNAVLCRCMPSQAKGVVETRTYELRDFLKHSDRLGRLRGAQPTTFWPVADTGEEPPLERLRWPRAF